MAISAKDVMALRQRTSMGMMECKKALTEADGNFDAAVDLLRAAAKGKMDERTDREAAEGTIAIATEDGSASMVELNSETDFTAKNDTFIEAAQKCAQIGLAGPDGETAANDQITATVDEVRLTTKENCSFKRGVKVSGPKIGSYVHHNRKVGSLVVIDGDVDEQTLTGMAQHVSALDGRALPLPLAVDESGLPAETIEEKRQEFAEEAKASGKPAEIAEKMATGKLRKWIGEVTLLGQAYVRDMSGKTTVKEALGGAKVVNYVRYAVGDA